MTCCNYCGADRGEYCAMTTALVYRGGRCAHNRLGRPDPTVSTRNPYFVSVSDVRKIAAESGLAHAEFCIGQMASQMGDARCVEQRAELDRLNQAAWREHEQSCAEGEG